MYIYIYICIFAHSHTSRLPSLARGDTRYTSKEYEQVAASSESKVQELSVFIPPIISTTFSFRPSLTVPPPPSLCLFPSFSTTIVCVSACACVTVSASDSAASVTLRVQDGDNVGVRDTPSFSTIPSSNTPSPNTSSSTAPTPTPTQSGMHTSRISTIRNSFSSNSPPPTLVTNMAGSRWIESSPKEEEEEETVTPPPSSPSSSVHPLSLPFPPPVMKRRETVIVTCEFWAPFRLFTRYACVCVHI